MSQGEGKNKTKTSGSKSPANLSDHGVVSSPARSVGTSIGSSRKRGICDSPFVDVDDFSFVSSTSGVSISRTSTSSYRSKPRSRARSRIFSPASVDKAMATATLALTDKKIESKQKESKLCYHSPRHLKEIRKDSSDDDNGLDNESSTEAVFHQPLHDNDDDLSTCDFAFLSDEKSLPSKQTITTSPRPVITCKASISKLALTNPSSSLFEIKVTMTV